MEGSYQDGGMAAMDGPQEVHNGRFANQPGPLFSNMFPVEIRLQIYEIALKDKRLSMPIRTAWDVAPGLLRTCRHIYNEAKLVFYRVNTFAFIIFRKFSNLRPKRPCPILPKFLQAQDINSNLRFVRKLIIYTALGSPETLFGTGYCRRQVSDLSRALETVPRLCIVINFNWVSRVRGAGQDFSIEGVWEPLSLLKNIEEFAISGVRHQCYHSMIAALGVADSFSGNKYTPSVYGMFIRLQSYARSFERDPRRKKLVGVPYSSLESYEAYAGSASSLAGALGYALNEALVENYESFNIWRRRVLFILEDRYQQIQKARRILLENGRFFSRHGDNLDRVDRLHHYYEYNSYVARGIGAFFALERFAQSFLAEPSDEVRREYLLKNLPPYNDVYKTFEREQCLIKLGEAALQEELKGERMELMQSKGRRYDWTTCEHYFKKALDDMLSQLEEIRRLRNEVFDTQDAQEVNEAGLILGKNDNDPNNLDDHDIPEYHGIHDDNFVGGSDDEFNSNDELNYETFHGSETDSSSENDEDNSSCMPLFPSVDDDKEVMLFSRNWPSCTRDN